MTGFEAQMLDLKQAEDVRHQEVMERLEAMQATLDSLHPSVFKPTDFHDSRKEAG